MRPFFLFALFITSLQGEWSHIELGAGNYGSDGYSKTSQKEVIKNFIVTEKPNYVDRLPDKGYGNYDPYEQYAVLFWTLDELVRRYGAKGRFCVNDINPSYADEAARQLKLYAEKKGYGEIRIESLPGDYLNVNNLYDTAHLKNPEVTFYNEKMDGDDFHSTPASRGKARKGLQKLASLSKTGLTFFTLYDNVFFPDLEKEEYVNKGLFYHESRDWEAVPYVFPRGQFFQKGKVFHINGT